MDASAISFLNMTRDPGQQEVKVQRSGPGPAAL